MYRASLTDREIQATYFRPFKGEAILVIEWLSNGDYKLQGVYKNRNSAYKYYNRVKSHGSFFICCGEFVSENTIKVTRDPDSSVMGVIEFRKCVQVWRPRVYVS